MLVARRSVVAAAVCVACGLGGTARAAEAPFGPKVGTKAPPIGALPDHNGAPQNLAFLYGAKGVVLMFFRAASWCPYCQAQLIAVNEGAAEIERRGYKIAGISYEAPAANKDFIQNRAIKYALLSDEGSKVIDAWGLRDPQFAPGSRAYGVPRPIIFVIDRSGVIRASIARERYQERPPVTEILAALDEIG